MTRSTRRIDLQIPIIPSRQFETSKDVIVCSSLDEALLKAFNRTEEPLIEKVFVIGGGQIYKQAINLPECDSIYITKIHHDIECDTFFPSIPSYYDLIVWSVPLSPLRSLQRIVQTTTLISHLKSIRRVPTVYPFSCLPIWIRQNPISCPPPVSWGMWRLCNENWNRNMKNTNTSTWSIISWNMATSEEIVLEQALAATLVHKYGLSDKWEEWIDALFPS